ncbi:MAG: hypothetical protein QM703_26765 [Gemmatales bacterium]
MATLRLTDSFLANFTKLKNLDMPAAIAIRDMLRDIQTNPVSGIVAARATPVLGKFVNEIAKKVSEALANSGVPHDVQWFSYKILLLEGRVPPPIPTFAVAAYVPEGSASPYAELKRLFSKTQKTDVAAILFANVWLRDRWLLS